jgi:hypothetical protein
MSPLGPANERVDQMVVKGSEYFFTRGEVDAPLSSAMGMKRRPL